MTMPSELDMPQGNSLPIDGMPVPSEETGSSGASTAVGTEEGQRNNRQPSKKPNWPE